MIMKKKQDLSVKAKVYFTLYAYARDSVVRVTQIHHQNNTRILYAHPRIFVTAHAH